jgi:hypothetical protein
MCYKRAAMLNYTSSGVIYNRGTGVNILKRFLAEFMPLSVRFLVILAEITTAI